MNLFEVKEKQNTLKTKDTSRDEVRKGTNGNHSGTRNGRFRSKCLIRL